MNKLTLKEFNKIKPEEIFARGIIENSPKGLFMTNNGGMLRWIAIKGYGNDWAIYAHWDYQTEEYIKEEGNKVTANEDIRKLVSCTNEVFALYRY